MKRAWQVFGWLVLALLLLIVVAVGWLAGTEPGSRWALGRVPGLDIEGFSGRLGRQWGAERLVWRQGDRQVVLEAPSLTWRPSCLARLMLCIEEARARRLELVFPPTEDAEPDRPVELPRVQLPFGLDIDTLELGAVTFNGEQILDGARLQGRWTQQGLSLAQLQLQREEASLSLTGNLRPEGRWPISLQGQARLPAPVDEPWALAFQADGALKGTLSLQARSSGYLDAALAGEVRPLDPQLPAMLAVTSDALRLPPAVPPTLAPQQLALTLEGDLEEGYRLDGEASLPGEDGPVAVAVEGLLRRDGLHLEPLLLSAPDNRFLRLAGTLGWQDAVRADLSVHWLNFPWQSLYPLEQELPVQLQELTGELQYEDGDYLGHFDAQLKGPAGAFSLSSPFSGDLEQVHLPQLQLTAGQGSASGNLSLGFAEGLSWATRLELSQLNPAYWLEQLPGTLGGTLVSEGRLDAGALAVAADLSLQGQLREQPASLQLALSGDGQDWRLAGLDFRLGDNRVQGQGGWGEVLEGALTLDMARLAQLWPGLTGQATGRLNLSGTPAAPEGDLQLKGQDLAFDDQRVAQLQLTATVEAGERGRLALTASDVAAGETALGDLTLAAQGTRAQHEVSLELQGSLVNLALALQGGLDGEAWRGQLLSARVEGLDQRWTLREPTALVREADGAVRLAAHCWVSAPASLCAEQQRLYPAPQLDYRLVDFPLERLADALPEDFAWQGVMQADIALSLPETGLQGAVTIAAGPGVLRVREDERWIDFPYETLSLTSELAPEEVRARLTFEGGDLGRLQVNALIDPRGEVKPLDGQFALSGLQLRILRPFLRNVDRLEGELSGTGQLAGTLQQPLVRGELTLSNGLVAGERLPTRVENLKAQLRIEGDELLIDGDWTAGAGRGAVSGTLDWAQGLDLDLRVTGQRLPVVVEPYAEVEVSPDLAISLADGGLAIRGALNVPRGEIVIRDLPASTVRVSPDAVIVGEAEEAPAEPPLDLTLDIDVQVGQERLRFSGLGLTADLVGQLHIGDDFDTRGELVLKNGRYRAYGQRLALRRARLLFTGPASQPFLDVEAVRRIEAEDVVAGLRITGSTRNPEVEVFAEPAMSQEQALSYLILGRAPGAESGDNNLLAQAALGLGLSRSTRFTGALAERLGIEDFQLETEGSGGDTSVVASGRLTDRLSLRYGVGVFEAGDTVTLRYQLTRRLFLEAAAGLANSLDLFYRRDF